MENYVLTALCEMGYPADALRRLRARYAPLAENDSSTLWEDFFVEGTHNHAWSGAPVNVAFRYLLGLQPIVTPDGKRSFTVNPSPALQGPFTATFRIGEELHTVTVPN
jgi:hypothetical protein